MLPTHTTSRSRLGCTFNWVASQRGARSVRAVGPKANTTPVVKHKGEEQQAAGQRPHTDTIMQGQFLAVRRRAPDDGP
jgi:hypothetical protein